MKKTIEDLMRTNMEDAMWQQLKGAPDVLDYRLINLPCQHRARVHVRMDREGDIVLRPQAERWLNRNIKGGWGVAGFHNLIESDLAEAVFGFETEADLKTFIAKWAVL